jgi:hypothetical protein
MDLLEYNLPSTLVCMAEIREQAAERLLEHLLPHTHLVPGRLPQPPGADTVFAKRTGLM